MKQPKFRKPDELDSEIKETISIRVKKSDLEYLRKAAKKTKNKKTTVSGIVSAVISDYVVWLKETS